MINTKYVHIELLNLAAQAKSGIVVNQRLLIDTIAIMARMIDDLNERLTRVEQDLDAAGIPDSERAKRAKRELDKLGWPS